MFIWIWDSMSTILLQLTTEIRRIQHMQPIKEPRAKRYNLARETPRSITDSLQGLELAIKFNYMFDLNNLINYGISLIN